MTTPREQTAIYSTQLTYSTNTSPTYVSILNDVDYRLSNVVPSSDKIRWMNQAVRDIWKYTASTKWHSTNTEAGQAIYGMSTDMRFETIKAVYVSDSTARSTTELYEKYTLAGMDDELSGNCYYKAGHGIGLYPVPTSDDEKLGIKIPYEPVPVAYGSTTDTTSIPAISNDYTELITFALCRRIALAGNAPDVDLANNYDIEHRELLKKAKMDRVKRKAQEKEKWSYKNGWWTG